MALLPLRWAPLFGALGPWARGAGAGLVAFLLAQAADPFVAQRSWLYAPQGCDLAVAFPRRAAIVAGEIRLAGKTAQTVTRAVLTDVGSATTFSAECVDIGRVLSEAEKAALLDAAQALLTSSAKRLGLKIERVARAGGTAVVLVGTSDEGRTATNEVLLRRAEGHAVLGASSILVLWAWKIGRAGETAPFGEAFFASVHPRRSAVR